MHRESDISRDIGEPKILIRKTSEMPADRKNNPFFDAEIFASAETPEDVYLPDHDEAISFSIAAHEIGHLVAEGKRHDTSIDNYEAVLAEEQRAWEKGWQYIEKYLAEYFDQAELTEIRTTFEKIKDIMLQATVASKDLYLESGSMDEKNDEEYDDIVRKRRVEFFEQGKGVVVKELFEKVKKCGNKKKPNWDKLVTIVTKAIKDILKDNKNQSKSV